jgi:hypothetical protein
MEKVLAGRADVQWKDMRVQNMKELARKVEEEPLKELLDLLEEEDEEEGEGEDKVDVEAMNDFFRKKR